MHTPPKRTIPNIKRGKLVDMRVLGKTGPEDRLSSSISASQKRKTCKQKTDQGLQRRGNFRGGKGFCFLVLEVATFICVHLSQLNLYT